MRLRWRPLANDPLGPDDVDRHESMLAVATAPIKGASSGGTGLLMLWSWNRPFMPLSVVEGHKEGAVTGFHWLDTPASDLGKKQQLRKANEATVTSTFRTSSRVPGSKTHQVDDILFENSEHDSDSDMLGIWQHVLSVGRDGRCLIQSFARGTFGRLCVEESRTFSQRWILLTFNNSNNPRPGDRPISRVPPSTFAMANLSPYQEGYGSLQIFSVSQIPPGPRNEFLLTGLRRDIVTASAPGIFCENPVEGDGTELAGGYFPDSIVGNQRLPSKSPELYFNVVDQGDLSDTLQPITDGNGTGITVAPEVVHLSRFADRYEMCLGEKFHSRVEICMHNASVAHSLCCEQLAQMWKMVAIILDNSGTDGLLDRGSEAGNVMQFVLLPTIRSILEERADAGDVQTCVTLCQVLEVVTPEETVKIPDLEIELVREWYLSYIDLLQGMCLFSQVTFLIRNCADPFIGALNRQSTTYVNHIQVCFAPVFH